MTKLTTKGVSVIDGVEVDISIRGDEETAERVLMELKEHCGRIGQAYDEQRPPKEVTLSAEYAPIMTVDWSGVFAGGE